MKLRTTLVPFLLLFSLPGCYSSGALVAEGGGKVNQKPIVDRWATDAEWLGQAKGAPTDEERDALVQADKERADAQLGEELSEEEAKVKLEAAKVKLEAEQVKAEEEAKVKLEAERKAKEQAEEEAKIKIAQNILKLKALNSCVNCNLSGANFEGADLRSADLTGANLSGANLKGADLKYVEFSQSLIYSKGKYVGQFARLGAGSYPADLTGADLTGANLSGADLTKVNLRSADLTGADLTGAFLWEAHLKNANLTGAILKDTKVEGAIFCNTKTPWGLDNSGCKE
jgi:uncharacterized protein YjbI with pentapeptide repeats